MPQITKPFITRSFYLLLLAGWAGAVGLMFITAVWGGLQGLLDQPVIPRESVHLGATSLAAGKKMVNATTKRLKGQEPAQPSPRPSDASYRRMLASDLLTGVESVGQRVEKFFNLDRKPAPRQSAAPAEPAPAESPAKTAPAPAVKDRKTASRGQGQLFSADFDCDANRFIMTLGASGPLEPMTWFTMDNPRRLVMDLHGQWASGLSRINELAGGFISSVHVGDHPEYIRFVCFLADPQSRSKLAPTFISSETGLSVFVLNPF